MDTKTGFRDASESEPSPVRSSLTSRVWLKKVNSRRQMERAGRGPAPPSGAQDSQSGRSHVVQVSDSGLTSVISTDAVTNASQAQTGWTPIAPPSEPTLSYASRMSYISTLLDNEVMMVPSYAIPSRELARQSWLWNEAMLEETYRREIQQARSVYWKF